MCLTCLDVLFNERETTDIKNQILEVKELLKAAEAEHAASGACPTLPAHIEELKAEQFRLSRKL